jgi:hypothetical protein
LPKYNSKLYEGKKYLVLTNETLIKRMVVCVVFGIKNIVNKDKRGVKSNHPVFKMISTHTTVDD